MSYPWEKEGKFSLSADSPSLHKPPNTNTLVCLSLCPVHLAPTVTLWPPMVVRTPVMGHRLEVSVSACRKPDSYDWCFRESQHRRTKSLDDKLVAQPSDEQVKRIMLVSFSSVWHLPERSSSEARKIRVVPQFQSGANCICCFRSELEGNILVVERVVEEAAHLINRKQRHRKVPVHICPYKTCSQQHVSSMPIVSIASQ